MLPRMSHSFTNILVHAVFATKDRREMISDELRPRLHEYIGGIARSESCALLAAGGMPDHDHLLFKVHPSISVADLLRTVKSRSSGWIHQTFPDMRDFAWQNGYGGFSVSESSVPDVRRYLDNQAEHHRSMTFQEEFIALLKKHGIEYDPRYVWE